MNIKTKLIHTFGSPDENTQSIVPSLHLSTSFAMEEPTSNEGFQYGRVGNPTREILEKTLADLEGAKFAAVFSSGSAAFFVLLLALKTGDHIVCHKELYEGTLRIIKKVFINFGIHADFVDFNDLAGVKRKITNRTKLILIESPTNPSLTILDIEKICSFASKRKIKVVVDNTFATALIQQPLTLGADIVIESLTKAINGHTDSMGGLIATNNQKIFKGIKFLQHTLGAVLSPFDCFLILRSLKTLPIRLEQQQKNAKVVAKFLSIHKKISDVFFPGLLKDRKRIFLKKQMQGSGFMISFALKDVQETAKFLKSLKIIKIAHSFGGTETLIQQPNTMMDLTFRKSVNNILRLSVGLEDVNDLTQDLNQALQF